MTDDEIEKAAQSALDYAHKHPKLVSICREVAASVTKRELRRQIRSLIKPFTGDEPPQRPADPDALAEYFEIPLSYTPAPVLPSLRPSAKTPITKEEKRLYSREFWRLVFKEHDATLEDFHPQRVRVFYRLVRQLARHLRTCADDQLLLDLGPDDWTRPLVPSGAPSLMARRTTDLLKAGQLALLPPDLSPEAQANLAAYDPLQDSTLVRYCEVLSSLSSDLEVLKGTKIEAQLGRYGLQGLLDPRTIRLCVPSPVELVIWERQLVEDALAVMASRGTQKVYDWLKRHHGFLSHECVPIVKASKSEACKRTEEDIEEGRALMLLRLDDLRRRARKGLQPTIELGALKLQAVVQGFSRVEPENAISEFVATVRRVNNEAPAVVRQLDLENDPDQDDDRDREFVSKTG